ncbi:MAG: tRNA (adenosine(37)-N6)-threonylcarbamoyltransferase complex dimerization subunit type 1 TsaB [Solirubrobacteraceae bacterium]
MRILAFDTATPRTAVALRDIDTGANVCMLSELDLTAADDPPVGSRPGHAQRLLSLIDGLMVRGGTDWSSIDRIAVGAGPGTFTGLRIGIASAQALAAARALPLAGVSTLRSLALAAHDRRPQRATLAVIDARRGEAFVAGWAGGEDPLCAAATLSACVLTPEQLARVAGATAAGTQAVGDGALKFRELLEAAGVTVPHGESQLHRVSAREHCRLGALAQPSADGRIEPDYLRVPDAEVAKG